MTKSQSQHVLPASDWEDPSKRRATMSVGFGGGKLFSAIDAWSRPGNEAGERRSEDLNSLKELK